MQQKKTNIAISSRKVILTIFLLFSGLVIARGQQIAMFSEFMLNDFIYNPAMGGKNGIPILNIGYRSQWVGFEGAPKTFYLSGNGTVHKNERNHDIHDVGGYMFSESIGIQSNRGISASYAYHKEIFDDHELSMGTFLGIREYAINNRELILPEYDASVDRAIKDQFRRSYTPDGAIGMLFYNEDYYAGFSLQHIFRGRFRIGDLDYPKDSILNRLYGHFYFMAGYEYLLNDEFSIQPNMLFKATRAAPAQLDLNAKLNYKDRAFFGLTYRTYDAMSFTIGVDIDNVGEFGYAYDLGISKFRTAHAGSHEVILTFRFEDYKRKSKFKKDEEE